MATLFTADLHLGHANVLRFQQCPFADVTAMNVALVERWNECVQPEDDIWVLGDFAYRSSLAAETWLRRLNGSKHLVWGNHDKPQTRQARGWASAQSYAEIIVEGRKAVMLHYGMRVWPGMRFGAVHLYGHSHGNLPGWRLPPDAQGRAPGGCLDVGVDCWNFRPVSMEQILERIATLPLMPGTDEDLGDDA